MFYEEKNKKLKDFLKKLPLIQYIIKYIIRVTTENDRSMIMDAE